MVVVNQKGGVGKTTTAVNLAAALATGGLSVLLVDMDPQGNASTALGVDHRQGVRGTYEVLIEQDDMAWHVVPSPEAPRLSVLPATIDLAAAEIELVSITGREHRLLDALTPYLAANQHDYVIFDCPPSLGLLTLNALVAADGILVPLQVEFYALEGITSLLQTVDAVRTRFNPALEIEGVVLTMYDKRNSLSVAVETDVRTYFGERVFKTVIPRNVRVSEAPSHGKPVLLYDLKCSGSQAYMRLASEMLQREKGSGTGDWGLGFDDLKKVVGE